MGRSNIVVKPMAMLLLHANATVTICHSRTQNLAEIVKHLPRADGAPDLRLPGERGARLAQRRRSEGVPVAAKIWAELVELATKFNVAVPKTA